MNTRFCLLHEASDVTGQKVGLVYHMVSLHIAKVFQTFPVKQRSSNELLAPTYYGVFFNHALLGKYIYFFPVYAKPGDSSYE